MPFFGISISSYRKTNNSLLFLIIIISRVNFMHVLQVLFDSFATLIPVYLDLLNISLSLHVPTVVKQI